MLYAIISISIAQFLSSLSLSQSLSVSLSLIAKKSIHITISSTVHCCITHVLCHSTVLLQQCTVQYYLNPVHIKFIPAVPQNHYP